MKQLTKEHALVRAISGRQQFSCESASGNMALVLAYPVEDMDDCVDEGSSEGCEGITRRTKVQDTAQAVACVRLFLKRGI